MAAHAESAGVKSEEVSSYTRAQVAKLLCVSREAVRHFEKKGVLHPKVNGDGIHRFDRQEVQAFARSREAAGLQKAGLKRTRTLGEITAAAFRRFTQGETVLQVCEAEQIDYRLAEELLDQHGAAGSNEAVLARRQERERLEDEKHYDAERTRRRELLAGVRRGGGGSKPDR